MGMFRGLLTGLPVMILCLVIEAIFVTRCLRFYARNLHARRRFAKLDDVLLLTVVMTYMLVGNFAQTAVWASLFMLLGEFKDPSIALYYSAVNFSTLGYGDVLMSERWRLLGPLEAANGILMFGVSTSVMTAAVIDVLKRHRETRGL
jgi:hypothetical protein